MAIRQLPFDKGQDFDITNKATRMPSDEVLENMKKYLEDKDTLIVKCGKSFWDVTAVPEIFDVGEEFRVEDLNSIDRKQMERQAPPKPAFVSTILKDPANNPLAELYHRTDEEEKQALTRKTYYLRETDVEALEILRHWTRADISALVRAALERGLSAIAEESQLGYDLYAKAEENVASGGFDIRKKRFEK